MKTLLLIFAIISILAYPAFCQIDTLQLVEIGSIQAPSAINELYVEDLDGDSLKEIILCTDSYVYIYNSQTYEVEWTSPPLNHPTDLLFEDINRDGFIDFSVKDSTNIYLFDPHTPQTIWTSPELDTTYSCYTLGDRNGDSFLDAAIVSKDPFDYYDYDIYDTVWVDLFNGPDFNQQTGFIILMINRVYVLAYYGWYFSYPISVAIEEISGQSGLESRIIIFSHIEEGLDGPDSYYRQNYSGGLLLFESQNFDTVLYADIGICKDYFIQNTNNSLSIYTLGHISRYYHWDLPPTLYFYGRNKLISSFSADTITTSDSIWWYPWNQTLTEWDGYTIGDFIDDSPGLELCFGVNDSLYAFSFYNANNLWARALATELSDVFGLFYYDSLFNTTQIICAIGDPIIEYRFYNGSDGTLSGVLPNSGYELSKVSDLNNDNRDEILSIQNTSMQIYGLAYATGIGDDLNLPYPPFLRPNYPNPFNSSTTIEYGLPVAGRVRIDIYDLLGRKVETLVNEDMPAGRHKVVWEASAYSSGVYFYRIESGDFVDTRRMMYLK